MKKKVLLALDWYDYQIHRGVAQVAASLGWSLFCNHENSGEPSVFPNWSGDGIIALVDREDTESAIVRCGVPTIDLGLKPHRLDVKRAVVDNNRIAKLAADYFLDLGFHQFILESEGSAVMMKERADAFCYYMKKGGAKPVPLDRLTHHTDRKKFHLQLKSIEKPIAHLAHNDGAAVAFIHEALDAGIKVPYEIAVLGVDDNDLLCEGLEVSISSVQSDLQGLGRCAAMMLNRMFNGEKIDDITRHQPIGINSRMSTNTLYSGHPIVSKAIQFIQNNLQNGINATQLAEKLYVSPQYLQRIFSEHSSFTPASAIRGLRLRLAQRLILKGDLKLRDVAKLSGYRSTEMLCKAFQKYLNMTANEWKKKNNSF